MIFLFKKIMATVLKIDRQGEKQGDNRRATN
jgi:hypothetical protein